MLYEVLITVCLIANPAHCRQVPVPVKLYASIRECSAHAQVDALRWAERKPGWRIAGWTCAPPSATI
ncbi:hypothetical protein [Breoghania sp. L-A4]|uniref:hypothetical protein n=1 Tax=Breoghania sp. L-A4 TaxID=2304600 RepID=UPI0013C2C9B6|nr:hypothetical protein [Breoghania sp. L-A4]